MSTMAQPDSKPAAVAAPAVSGKDALLARIQAAKAKSQQTSLKPAPTTDLLDFGAPAPAAAPANGDFDLLGGGAPAAAPTSTPALAAAAATPSNAGTFESLMATTTTPQPAQASPAAAAATAVPEPAAAPAEPEIDAGFLAALPPGEREALLAEQRQIMEEIERKKAAAPKPLTGAAAAAAAFNSRSAAAVANVVASVDSLPAFARPPPVTPPRSNVTTTTTAAAGNDGTVNLGDGESVPLHGKEQTDQAIKDGTALVVQCMSCNNWMQVTGEANLMLCPVCGVVCPVEKTGATANMDKAAQVAADQQLAEELQKEEYKQVSNYRERRRTENNAEGGAPGGQSWMDWLAGTPSPAPGTAAGAAAVAGGRPTGATPRSLDERQGLIAGASPQRGIGGGGGGAAANGQGARVAQQPTSLFACVADSITSAAEQMTGIQLSEDKEGNVHGVDSSSLLI